MATYQEQEQNRELGWDDTIENDYESSFVLLPEGDYDFEVTAFERGRYEPRPGAKIPACNMATLTLEVGSDQAAARVRHNLYLHTSTEGLLCTFFTAIGQRRHGEKLRMDWGSVVGSRGRLKLGIRTWRSRNGEPMQSNEVKRFYEPGETQGRPAGKAGYTEGTF